MTSTLSSSTSTDTGTGRSKTPRQLEALVEPLLAISGTKYLFIDEVQNVEGFEDVLNGFRTEGGFSIFITRLKLLPAFR